MPPQQSFALIRQCFLLRSGLLCPTRFRWPSRAPASLCFPAGITPPSVDGALLASDRCLFSLFAAWFPGGATLSRPYLRRSALQLATTSALTPLLHQTPGGSVPAILRCPSRGQDLSPRTVSSFIRVATRRDFSYRIAPTGSLGRGGEASPDHACLFPTAHSRTTPGFPGVYSLASHAPAGGFSTTSSLAVPRAPYSWVRDPIARSFASEPPGPRLTATPYHFGYPAQERSTGAGFAPARCTPCRAYECG